MTTLKENEKKKRRKYPYSNDKLAAVWETSYSVDEVVQRTGLPREIILARISKLRTKKGVYLKPMPRNPVNRVDPNALNELLAHLRKLDEPTRQLPADQLVDAVYDRMGDRHREESARSRMQDFVLNR